MTMTRFLSALCAIVCIATAFGLGGCTTTRYVGADGSKMETTTVGLPTHRVYVAPDFDWEVNSYHSGGGDTRGIACNGPFGQTIGGRCFPTIDQCRAVYGRKRCG